MKQYQIILLTIFVSVFILSACSERVDRDSIDYADENAVDTIFATVETTPVSTDGDAADDPAIWIHPTQPENSRVIGTNKKSGLAVYNLSGEQVQFLHHGLPNNVDIRQNVTLSGLTQPRSQDLGGFSDRKDNTVGWISINENGIKFVDSFKVKQEPYGFCLGQNKNSLYAFVTYKDGLIEQYQLVYSEQKLSMPLRASYKFDTQLEGCVMDDTTQTLFVGEEEHGIWVFTDVAQALDKPILIDKVGSENGIVADIEGLALFRAEQALLIASSQENDSFAVYEASPPYTFKSRFRIKSGPVIDGAQETDGIEVTHLSLPGFEQGLIIAQDGYNNDGKQNFKFAPLNL